MTDEHAAVYEQIRTSTDYFQKAKLIAFLVRQNKIRIKDVAERLHLTQSYVCHILRLNKLSELIMDGYYSHLISISHLFVISLLHSQEDMMDLYEAVLRENLSVQATEEQVRMKLHNVSSEGEYINSDHIRQVTTAAAESYGATVKVVQTRVKTKILFEWKGSRKQRKEGVTKLLHALSGDSEPKE
jgi:ParB-like chromosome segregation protein Spo0J